MLIWISALALIAAVVYTIFALLVLAREEPPEW